MELNDEKKRRGVSTGQAERSRANTSGKKMKLKVPSSNDGEAKTKSALKSKNSKD